MNNIFMVMNISGTTALLVYYMGNFILRNYLKAKWKRTYLSMIMFFYLVPVAKLKYVYSDFLPWKHIQAESNIVRLKAIGDGLILMKNTGVITSEYYKKNFIFYVLCISIAVCVFLYWWTKLRKARRVLEKYSFQVSTLEEIQVNQFKKEYYIKQKIILAKSSRLTTSLVAGIVVPILLLPDNIKNEEDFQYIVRHELAHIKHNDILWNFISITIIAIHWYNPFVYLLFYILQEINEQFSDEMVVEKLEKERRISYCKTLIDMSERARVKKVSIASLGFLGNSSQQIKRRIDAVMCKKRKNVFAALLLGMGMCFYGNIVALAYAAPVVITEQESEGFWMSDYEEFIPALVTSESLYDTLLFDDSFVDVNGNTYELPAQGTVKVICNHTYTDGTRKKHKLQSNGSCIVEYFNARRCNKCGRIESQELLKTERYTTCPH